MSQWRRARPALPWLCLARRRCHLTACADCRLGDAAAGLPSGIPPMSVNVLILTDQPTIRAALAALVQGEGGQAFGADSLATALQLVQVQAASLVLAGELRRGPGGAELCRA